MTSINEATTTDKKIIINKKMSGKQITEHDIDAIFDKAINVDDLFNHAPFLMAFSDSKGYLSKVNPLWENVIGYSLEEITNTPFIDFLHPDDVEKSMKQYIEGEIFNKDAKRFIGFTNRYKCKDGRYAILEWYSTGQNMKGHNLAFAIFRGYE